MGSWLAETNLWRVGEVVGYGENMGFVIFPIRLARHIHQPFE